MAVVLYGYLHEGRATTVCGGLVAAVNNSAVYAAAAEQKSLPFRPATPN